MLALALIAGVAALAQPDGARAASREDEQATAATLSRSGRHAEAARAYEDAARRGIFGWDDRVALLAAREYLAAGQLDDAERMLGKARGRLREDDAVLRARVEAEVALARNDPQRALTALRDLPQPLPAPLAVELLALRAQAEFASGRALDGVRTLEERGRVLGSPDARAENNKLLVDSMLQHPAPVALPPDATDSERAWLELGQILGAPGSDAAALARRSADWRARHPGHPGSAFLPGAATAAASAGAAITNLPENAPGVIALLLPLSGRQQSAGTAVRDGFMAAWFATPAESRPRVEIYDTAAVGGVSAAYQRAIGDGAQTVVGPLTREDAVLIAAGPPLTVPTLVLNSVATTAPPPFLFQFSLDPEQEARAVARRIAEDGRTRGVALFPDSPWGQRIKEAFTAELQSTGVALTATAFYEPGAKDFSDPLREALGRFGGAGDRSNDRNKPAPKRDPAAEQRDGPQFAFVAATPAIARALRPQLRFQMTYDLPFYSTSDAWDPSVRSASDMDGMVFPEMPWILYGGQGAPELWDVVHGEWSADSRGRLRLYAFGFDAYRLAGELRGSSRAIGLDGLTGELEIGSDGRVQRRLQFARIEDGRPQPAGTGVPLAPPQQQ